MVLQVLQIVGIFIVSWFGFINMGNSIKGHPVAGANCAIVAVGICLIFLRVVF